jgi:hypothetical protein
LCIEPVTYEALIDCVAYDAVPENLDDADPVHVLKEEVVTYPLKSGADTFKAYDAVNAYDALKAALFPVKNELVI